jgi:predicted dehydrogenase
VVAVADLDEERRERAAAQYGIERRYRDVTALLAGAPVDAVGVCVPAPDHAGVAAEVFAAGRHVLVEKPLAASMSDCNEIIAAAAAAGVTTAVGLNLRSHRLVREARRIVEAGLLGPLELIATSYTDTALFRPDLPLWRRELKSGTSLLEKGVHDFDLWRMLGGSEAAVVVAMARDEPGDDSTVAAAGRLENGTSCCTALSGLSGQGHDIVLCGQERRLEILLGPQHPLFPVTAGRPRRALANGLSALAGLVRGTPAAVLSARREDQQGAYRAEWEDFADAIRTGGPPAATLDDGRHGVAVALATIRSLAEQRPIAVTGSPSAQA